MRADQPTAPEPAAPLFFVSPGQLNFQMPSGTAAGKATIEVIGGEVVRSTARVQIEATGPGVFTANASGQGIAAAIAVKVAADSTQTSQLVFQCGQASGSCVANPIDMGALRTESISSCSAPASGGCSSRRGISKV